MSTMQTPAFFDQVAPIVVHDALAQTLGATRDGLIEYRYVDAVKLAGHSCPTVAGAWLMTRAALARLYPGETPQRGELRVELRETQDAGVSGVIASVVGLLTGAAGPGGFKGLAGRHARRELLQFGAALQGELRFTRLDSGRSVELSLRLDRLVRTVDLRASMQAALAPDADEAARERFAEAWQDRVRTLLVEHADDATLIDWHS